MLQILARNGLQLLSTMVLARLVAPGEFGLFVLCGTLTTFLMFFADLGLPWAAIQSKELRPEQVNALFWINVASGAFFWLVCVAAGPLVEAFYQQPGLTGVLAVSGAGFLAHGIAAQPQALLGRSLRFGARAIVDIATLVAGAGVSIGLAYQGYGVWSLAWGPLATGALRAIASWKLSGFRPSLRVEWGSAAAMFRFGGELTLAGFCFYLFRNLDDILIGRAWGPSELAFYNKAYFLMSLLTVVPANSLNSVYVPALSRSAAEGDTARFGELFRDSLSQITFFVAPACAGLALTAAEAVEIVYGDQWSRVAPVLLWFGLAGAFQFPFITTGWLLVSAGKTRHYLAWSAVSALVLAATFFASIGFGAQGVALAFFAVTGIGLAIPSQIFAHRSAGIPVLPLLRRLGAIYAAVFAMVFAVWMFELWVLPADSTFWFSLASKVAIGVVVYGGCSWLWVSPHPLRRAAR